MGSPPLYENQHTNLFDSVVGGGLGGFVFCYGVKRRGRPLRGGWSDNLPTAVGPAGGDGGDVVFLFSVALAGRECLV